MPPLCQIHTALTVWICERGTATPLESLQLRRLATSDRLGVRYQLLVNLRNGRITGVEALLR